MDRLETRTASGRGSTAAQACGPGVVDPRWRGRVCGFTLIELLIVVAIVATLMAIGVPGYAQALEAARVTRSIGDVRAMSQEIRAYWLINGAIPDTLTAVSYADHRDPWGKPYQFLSFDTGKGKGKGGGGGGNGGGGASGAPPGARKDKFIVPLNSQYDLYSMGKDGETSAPLTAPVSRDDIIMANDGGFVGLAADY